MGLNGLIRVGDKIKNYRKNLKLTQAEMAEKLELPRSTYAHYENNTREPNINTLEKIALVLNVSINDLIDYNTYLDKSNKEITSRAIEEIQKGFERVSDSREDSLFTNIGISMIPTNKPFNEILIYLINQKTFQKEFHLDTFDLTDLDKETIVNDIFQYTQFICSKMINSKKNDK